MRHVITSFKNGRIDILQWLVRLIGVRHGDMLTFFRHEGKLYVTRESYANLPELVLQCATRTKGLVLSNKRTTQRHYRTSVRTNTLPLKYKLGRMGERVLFAGLRRDVMGADEPVMVMGVEALELME